MKRALDAVYRFFLRFRYPVTLPEDIGSALGIVASNHLTFEEFVGRLTCPSCRPTRLIKFMPREKAEEAFQTAQRKERFQQNTLISYYFNEGWMEFVLHFDEQSRLRRIYVNHKQIEKERGIEIPLVSDKTFHSKPINLFERLPRS
jgi:hypothetical protein